MDVGAVSNVAVAQVQSAEANSDADIALLAKATDADKAIVVTLLEALPKPIPSVDPNLGRKLDTYA
jgi:hypothetical protein